MKLSQASGASGAKPDLLFQTRVDDPTSLFMIIHDALLDELKRRRHVHSKNGALTESSYIRGACKSSLMKECGICLMAQALSSIG